MEIARAMYLGGEIIYAHQCDYSSYNKEGLLCPVCREPVHLKKGGIKKPHFAHFPGTDPQKVEQCELRASTYSNSTEISNFIQDRGQRLKIFEQHFLSLISFDNDRPISNLEFNNWINSIKRDYNTVISITVNNCTDYFKIYYYQIADKYIKPITNTDNKTVLIQQEIALEAISYLCVKSSCNLLEYLLYYSIYKIYGDKQNKLFKQDITTQNVDIICNLVIKILIFNNWIEAFEFNNNNNKNKKYIHSQLLFHKEKCHVWLNNQLVQDTEVKQQAFKFLVDANRHFQQHDSTRILFELPLEHEISSIEILMKPAKEWYYSKESQRWIKQEVKQRKQKAQLNRRKTAFETNTPVSSPGKEENSRIMNGTVQDAVVYYAMYQHLQIKNEGKSVTDINYIQKTAKPVFCPFIQHIKINGKFWLSGLEKLKPQDINDRPTRTTVDKFKTGFLNGWSNTFSVQLIETDYLADKVRTDKPVKLQVALETNETLSLYLVKDRYYHNNRNVSLLGSTVIDVEHKSLTQERVKLLTLASVEVSELPIFQWVETKQEHEKLAKFINANPSVNNDKLNAAFSDSYNNLVLTNESVNIGDRVLVEKRNMGNKVIVRTFLNKQFLDSSNHVKIECQWLEQIRLTATQKMLQSNAIVVKSKVTNFITDRSNEWVKKGEHKLKKCLQLARQTIRVNDDSLSQENIDRLARLFVYHFYVTLKLNKHEYVGVMKQLQVDHNQYLRLVGLLTEEKHDHLSENNFGALITYR